MKNTLALALALASFSATAQETMITELESGDKWLRGGYSSAKFEFDAESQQTGQKASAEVDADFSEILFVTSLDSVDGLTPTLGVSVANLKVDDDSLTLYGMFAGGLFKTKEQKTYGIFGTYSSSDDDDVRDSLGLDIRVQTSSLASDVYNEVMIDTEYEFKGDGESGGHSIEVATVTRFNINPQLDFETLASLTLESDTDSPDNVSESHDPSIRFGGQLNVSLVESMTLEIGVIKSFSSSVTDEDGHKVDRDEDVTLTSINLMTRF